MSRASSGGRRHVRAAGGVVWRRVGGGIQVLLVHRPRYDDWSLPKGKLHPGEAEETAALREVEEETGMVCALGPELAVVSYVDGEGRDKTVRYWSMSVRAGAFTGGHEVDALRWLPLDEARRALSYPHDAAPLDALERLLATGAPGPR